MTTCTRRTEPPASGPRRRGFTLAEVMIAATLSVLVLAGVLSAALMIGRTCFNASAYSELDAQSRRALQVFGEDVRKASDIHWNDAQSITLQVATATSATQAITYAYDGVSTSPTYRCFYRLAGAADSPAPRQVLMRGVAPGFAFQRYKLGQLDGADNTAANDLETKQIGLTLRASRTGATTVAANHAVVSACYILRNKRVSN